MTHVGHNLQTVALAYSQNLDRDLLPAMFTLRHIRKPTLAQFHVYWVIVQLEMERLWKQGVASAYLV